MSKLPESTAVAEEIPLQDKDSISTTTEQQEDQDEDVANSTVVSIKLNTDTSEKKDIEAPNSPSISSLSSMESTEKLIKDLSSTNLNGTKADKGQVDSPIVAESPITNKIPQSVHSKTNFYNDLNDKSKHHSTENEKTTGASKSLPKKPITFTVRKVSHEPIKSPIASPVESHQHFRTSSSSSHHNSPDTTQTSGTKIRISSSELKDNPELKDKLKLKSIQNKYDAYEHRIVKIKKEIDFLIKLLPPYNVETDYNTRVKINKGIDKLRMKQDEIEKKKYSLGITLSRLWRSHEGGDIWVKKFDQ